jgi:hypothetical protein
MKRLSFCLLALVVLAAPAFADAAADAADVGKSLSVRTFQFKHKQVEKAAAVIKPLLSAEGSMSIQPSANSLVVTDAPENLKKIARVLQEFDAPVQPFRLAIRLVSAGKVTGDGDRVPDELRDVAPKLGLLRYNSLELIGAAEVLGKEGDPAVIDLDGYRADFAFGDYDPLSNSIKVSDFRLSRLEADQLVPMMKTTLNLRLGQTVIVGATKQAQSQRALMIVVSAKR